MRHIHAAHTRPRGRWATATLAALALTACDTPADTTSSPASTLAQPTASSSAVTATTPPPPQAPIDTPPNPPAPVTADPCHSNGVTYCVLNHAVTQATIGQTICVSGWTATIRPAESYTETLKRQQIADEGLPGGLSAYEEDHRMPLELGGAPADPMNLSPESPPTPNPKDSDESRLRREVCSGQLTLAAAQSQLVAAWLTAYPGYSH